MPSPHSHDHQHTTRRDMLGIAGLASLALGTPSLVAAAPVPAGPWESGPLPAVSGSSRRMAAAAHAFLAALGADQLKKAYYASPADQARTKWSNFPAGASPRSGISLGELSDTQRKLVHDLLRASTSSQGYHKMTGAIRSDDVLHELTGEALFGAAYYYTSVYGSPDHENWAWMLTGHHMSAMFTVAGERTAFTPMFTGAQPFEIPSGVHAGWRALPHDVTSAGDLLGTLSAEQRTAAILGTTAPQDVIAGPGRQASLQTFQGIAAGGLGDAQQRLLWTIVNEFVGNASSDAAAAQLELIRTSWRDVHFSWIGPAPDPAARFYFRVHGPRILIEYDVQEPMTSSGGHVHAITRDPANDYGMDWLKIHYDEPVFAPGGPGGPPPA